MCEVKKVLDVVSKLMRTTKELGDYTGNDGLLYCGKCHTAKQMRLGFNPITKRKEETLIPVVCQCQRKAEAEAERRAVQEQFRRDMARCYEDGIADLYGLQHHFSQDDRQQPKVSDACQRYAESWDEMLEHNIGILFYGNIGSGKSFLASCIGNSLLERQVPVVETNFPRLLTILQGTYDKQPLLDRLSLYKLLILDDLGAERESGFAQELIFNVIDARSNSKLPIIVTTNLQLEDLEHPQNMQYARIYDRILGMCPIRLKLTGESRRKNDAVQRQQLAKRILLG